MMSLEELAMIAALDALRERGVVVRCAPGDTTRVKLVVELANHVPELIEEIYRLRGQVAELKANPKISRDARIDALLEAIKSERQTLFSHGFDEILHAAHLLELEEKPVPMCRPDPLEDIIPPTPEKGGPP